MCFVQANINDVSAQMKLSDHHSCDSFSENMPIDIETAALLRECMDRSIAKMKENCSRVVSFAQVLMKLGQDSHLVCLSPLVLHCLYRTSVALSWMAMETSNEQYLIGKTICVNALQMMNTRWKAAGTRAFKCSRAGNGTRDFLGEQSNAVHSTP